MEQNNISESTDQEWERKDLHWRDERRRADDRMYQAKGVLLLMLLAAVLVLNLLLAGSVQLLTAYTYPEPTAVPEAYPGYTVLDSESTQTMAAFLIATPGGKPLLVTAEKHFLFDRWQLVSEENSSADPSILRGDGWSASVSFSGNDITDFQVSSIGLETNMTGLPEVIPFRVLVITLTLTVLELGLWALVRKLRKL